MRLYKLTTQDGYTRKGKKEETLWETGVTIKATGCSDVLCSDGVLHFYRHPLLAVFLNPIHANIRNPKLIECECGDIVADDGLKVGVKEATKVADCDLPILSIKQRVLIATDISIWVMKLIGVSIPIANIETSAEAAATRAAVIAIAAVAAAEEAAIAAAAAVAAAVAAEAAAAEAEAAARAAEAEAAAARAAARAARAAEAARAARAARAAKTLDLQCFTAELLNILSRYESK